MKPSAMSGNVKNRARLVYTADQWSPWNPAGQRRYSREQLLQLSEAPGSAVLLSRNRKPLSLVERDKQIFLPHFAINVHLSISHRLPLQHQHQDAKKQRNHHSGTHGNAKRSNCGAKTKFADTKANEFKPDIVHISLDSEVHLDKAVNAWKPRALLAAAANPVAAANDDTSSSKLPDPNIELYKSVRSILNKLTFKNFDILLEKIKSFNIDTVERLNGVTLLVFDKAIDEPNFAQAYAELCRNLVCNCFPVDSAGHALFKRTLVTLCQNEFTKNVVENTANEDKLKPLRDELVACSKTDVDRRDELNAIIAEEELQMRRKTVSTVKFIGELFLAGMLNSNIMDKCIRALLEKWTDEKLECLCKLLTTVGKDLEHISQPAEKGKCTALSQCIQQMRVMADKQSKIVISNRIRFMLLDVIDLSKNKWMKR